MRKTGSFLTFMVLAGLELQAANAPIFKPTWSGDDHEMPVYTSPTNAATMKSGVHTNTFQIRPGITNWPFTNLPPVTNLPTTNLPAMTNPPPLHPPGVR